MRHLLMIGLIALTGCGDKSMTEQKRYRIYGAAQSSPGETRGLPMHVVAQGDLARDEKAAAPPPVDTALLARGQERYEIYCSPCHGLDGNGRGAVVERGFPQPPSYLAQRLVAAPARHFYDVITNGYGVMFSYAARVDPSDRWAIVAYIRALQLAQQDNLSPREQP
jgi:mono/diheme cytochrome c family protein